MHVEAQHQQNPKRRPSNKNVTSFYKLGLGSLGRWASKKAKKAARDARAYLQQAVCTTRHLHKVIDRVKIFEYKSGQFFS